MLFGFCRTNEKKFDCKGDKNTPADSIKNKTFQYQHNILVKFPEIPVSCDRGPTTTIPGEQDFLFSYVLICMHYRI